MRFCPRGTIVVLLLAAAACGPSPTGQLAANKDLVRRFADAGNAADWEALATIVTEGFTRHSAASPEPVTSAEDFIRLQESFLTSFPDQHVTLNQLVAEGDYVAALATYTGTQTGPVGAFPATGRSASLPFLAMFRIEDGRIAELWLEWDNIAMLTQLGLFPPPGQ